MYDSYRDRLAPCFRESFPLPWIVGENLLYLLTWGTAGWILWPIGWSGWPVATIAWAALVVVVQVLLKKHNCSGCHYYGRSCHLGWGRLAARMFPQDSGNPRAGKLLGLVFYAFSPPVVLLAGILAGLGLEPGISHWVAVGVYVALNAASFPVRKKGCAVCAMREVCPGSAARG
jgi:hypothetical protein